MAIKLPFIKQHDRVILAPWEKRFDRILTPFEQFVQRETTTGFILMASALIALVLANSWIAEDYFHLQHISFGFHFGDWELNKSLHHWVNDGLMTIFFLVVGLALVALGHAPRLAQQALRHPLLRGARARGSGASRRARDHRGALGAGASGASELLGR